MPSTGSMRLLDWRDFEVMEQWLVENAEKLRPAFLGNIKSCFSRKKLSPAFGGKIKTCFSRKKLSPAFPCENLPPHPWSLGWSESDTLVYSV